MSTRPQPPIPPGDERPDFGPAGPLSTTDIQTLHTSLDVIRALGRMEHAVEVLERTTNAHGEKIHQVTRQADETKFAFSILDKAVALHGDRLRRLDKVA